MNKEQFTTSLKQPMNISNIPIKKFKNITDQYPYFQAARVIYLKALSDNESFKYNNELKKTAAYTSDRTVLFNFISSNNFKKQQANKKNENRNTNSIKKRLLRTKKPTNIVENAQQKLGIGSPLEFKKEDQHSFNNWLQLNKNQYTKQEKKPSKQDSIIDKFIKTNPKISKIDKSRPFEITVSEDQDKSSLMTETLARIYLEQKKYDSAIEAYNTLSLKYPEKSGFFADQINQIKILQKSK